MAIELNFWEYFALFLNYVYLFIYLFPKYVCVCESGENFLSSFYSGFY